jgi:hypothetical protein
MTTEILLREDEGFEFVATRGVAFDTQIVRAGKRYQITFISIARLHSDIDCTLKSKIPFDFRDTGNWVVVVEVNKENILEAISYFEQQGVLSYYEARS